MSTHLKRPVIALDGDGVVLDYNLGFGGIWEKYFDEKLVIVEPNAFHAHRFWGVTLPERGHGFWDRFHEEGWKSMPAMPGALEACHRLAKEYELVCVTSMPSHRKEDRLYNLKSLGFPIDKVIATGSVKDPHENPKRKAIEALKPKWFVDDELRKLKGLDAVQCVLIDADHPDTPNRGMDDRFLTLRVKSLQEFAVALLGPETLPKPKPRK